MEYKIHSPILPFILGMGDQIKRYCEKLEPEEYEELLDNEVRSHAHKS